VAEAEEGDHTTNVVKRRKKQEVTSQRYNQSHVNQCDDDPSTFTVSTHKQHKITIIIDVGSREGHIYISTELGFGEFLLIVLLLDPTTNSLKKRVHKKRMRGEEDCHQQLKLFPQLIAPTGVVAAV
jgi:predicted ATP-binding protein involved in virulence